LWVEIDDQNFLADGGERGAQIDCGRRLTDASLLIGNGEYARRPPKLRLRRAFGSCKGDYA